MVAKFTELLNSVVDSIKSHIDLVSTPKGLIVVVLGALCVLDVILAGKFGTIGYLMSVAKDLLTLAKDAGVPVLVALLVAILVLKNKAA